ncbi:unnamed protein product [Cyclocybe aegerita]|uniref:Uncharacterized protein n=1 Tax=Cyclocybe aegerita TaxID=1973307 RepID=A0A8S0WUM1_CYCAE|nr:unnamed protein product [Cyclocybe aegerita]
MSSSEPESDVVRTATHVYSAVEIFVLWSNSMGIQGHISLSALRRLEEMANRNLLEKINEKHAVDLRTNLLPQPGLLLDMDSPLPQMTLFLREDVLARTLSYEIDLAKYRLARVRAGHADPGRPPYEKVFPTLDLKDRLSVGPTTDHRVHYVGRDPIFRELVVYENTAVHPTFFATYSTASCLYAASYCIFHPTCLSGWLWLF